MMNSEHYLDAIKRIQLSSQFVAMTTAPPSFSASSAGRMPPQATTAPRTDQASTATAAMATPKISNKVPTTATDDAAAGTNGQSPRPLWRNGEKTFPYKVYDMLEFAESSGYTDICSWLPSGNSFVIHDRKLFTEFILPRFFLHKKWRSFTRQLNIWCFKRDFSVTVSDAYCHPFFKRGEVSKLSCVERAESKNLFKKCPLTNKRKPPTDTDGATVETKTGGKKQIVKKVSTGGNVESTSTAEASTKKRRITSQGDEEDVVGVASFLAGLKKSPDAPKKKSAPKETPLEEVAKPAEGEALRSSSSNKKKMLRLVSSNGNDKTAEAIIARRMSLMSQGSINSLPQGVATSSIAPLPSVSLPQTSIRPTVPTANPHLNIAGNRVMNNQAFPMNISVDGSFDRESLTRMSTEQLLALASRMKLREQMLRERAMALSLQQQPLPAMPSMAARVAATQQGSGWGDAYPEMFLQHQQEQEARARAALLQSRAVSLPGQTVRGSIPSRAMLSQQQGMVQSLMASTKPNADVELQHASTGIPNVSQNFGYPRAA